MQSENHSGLNKIAEITAIFWLCKIVATTLGETFGDFIAQTLDLGYVVGLGVTGVLLAVLLTAQLRARRYHPALFWAAIVGTTTAGTEISDFMDRTLNAGYLVGSLVLIAGLLATLALWYRREGNLSVDPITSGRAETMFWIAVLFSNSLGTAFGDYLVEATGLGYGGSAIICSAVIAVVLALHYGRMMNEIALFWIAFIFTRPFGASFGDLLTKPLAKGGLDLGTLNASLASLALIAGMVWLETRRPARLVSARD